MTNKRGPDGGQAWWQWSRDLQVWTYSTAPGPVSRGGTCPGATVWCAGRGGKGGKCYAAAGRAGHCPSVIAYND